MKFIILIFSLLYSETVSRLLFSGVLVAVFRGLRTSSEPILYPISLYHVSRSRYYRPYTHRVSITPLLLVSLITSSSVPNSFPPGSPLNLTGATVPETVYYNRLWFKY